MLHNLLDLDFVHSTSCINFSSLFFPPLSLLFPSPFPPPPPPLSFFTYLILLSSLSLLHFPDPFVIQPPTFHSMGISGCGPDSSLATTTLCFPDRLHVCSDYVTCSCHVAMCPYAHPGNFVAPYFSWGNLHTSWGDNPCTLQGNHHTLWSNHIL